MIQLRCETCGHKYRVPPRLAKRSPCPKCAAGVAPTARPSAPADIAAPAAAPARAAGRAATSGRGSVPEYPRLRMLGSFYTVVGYIWMGFSLLAAIGVAVLRSSEGSIAAALFAAGASFLGLAVTGIILIGMGEMIRAFRDLTRNSWRQSYLLRDAMNALAATRAADPVEREV